ncbi:MAG: hypothetical protein ACOC83_05020 [Gemmatimonadota bacterium]
MAAAAGVLAAHVFALFVADPDLWGHVLFGQLLLSDGLPRLDPFAYTSGDHPWINHEILSEVALGWAYSRFGSAGLQGLRYLLVGSVILLVWRELARGGLGAGAGALGTALVVSAMGSGLATIRPHLFTYLFFLLVLICLARTDHSETRWSWPVPLVLALWINFHGGVLAGVGVVGLWWAGEGLSALWDRRPRAVPFATATLVLAASVLALLANPYGWELPVFLLDTATEARPIITEWQPVTDSPARLALWTILTVLGLALVFWRRPRLRISHVLVLGVLAFLPLLAVRHLPLYALGWAVLLAPHMPDLAGWIRRRRRARLDAGAFRAAPEAALVALGLSVGIAGGVVAVERGSFPCVPLASEDHDVRPPPQEAVAVLERSQVSANLATPFGWGEYVIWHLSPRVRVGMDGRRETVYPDSVYEDYKAFRAGAGDWRRWLERYGADLALVMTESPPDNLLALKDGWREVHRDDAAALYGREAWPGTERVAEAGEDAAGRGDGSDHPGAGCFPG